MFLNYLTILFDYGVLTNAVHQKHPTESFGEYLNRCKTNDAGFEIPPVVRNGVADDSLLQLLYAASVYGPAAIIRQGKVNTGMMNHLTHVSYFLV
jgi:hypothetical protein